MKFPLDQLTFDETMFNLLSHANMQTVLIAKLIELLTLAMAASEHDDDPWYKESDILLKELEQLQVEHETRRWNQANHEAQVAVAPPIKPPAVYKIKSKVVKHLAEQPPVEVKAVDPVVAGLNDIQFDINMDQKANKTEEGFGPEMSENDLERHFNQTRTKKKKEEPKKLEQMTMEEIKEWEAKQDNATDIYKVAARIKNLARGGNASLTPQGEMLCNTYTHVMKAFYDFAEKLDDKTAKIQLIQLIRLQEGMPGNIIAAAGAGVKLKK